MGQQLIIGRGTTPTHTFNVRSLLPGEIRTAQITYAQYGRNLIVKTNANGGVKIDGTTICVDLTQEETLLFCDSGPAEAHLRVLTTNCKVPITDIFRVTVKRTLNDEVLT